MLVLPLPKDKIKTIEGGSFTVVEYTNFRKLGPALYAIPSEFPDHTALIYFDDIAEINGTKVEYQRGPKVFLAYGNVKRQQHIPQKGQSIIVSKAKSDGLKFESKQEVVDVRIKYKQMGDTAGMVVKCEDGNYYRMKNVIDVLDSNPEFSKSLFVRLYGDYLGT